MVCYIGLVWKLFCRFGIFLSGIGKELEKCFYVLGFYGFN